MLPTSILHLSFAVADAKHRRMRPGPSERPIAQGASQEDLKLIACHPVVFEDCQNLVALAQLTGRHLSPWSKDQMVGSHPKGAPPGSPGNASLHHELEKMVGAAVVEPVHHPARLNASGRWVVAQYLYGSPLIHDLADHFRTSVRQHHTSVVVHASDHDPYLLAELVDEDDRGVRLADRPHELAQRLGHQPRLEAEV